MIENLPQQDPEFFREAVRLTASQTGYNERLIEKDYYCTVLLQSLVDADSSLVFKGGTCLAKIHSDFYRLSEDLDFSIPILTEATRSQRRKAADRFKRVLDKVPVQVPAFQLIQAFVGANNSTQYSASVGYRSIVAGDTDAIKIEVGLREPLLMPIFTGAARTMLLDPITTNALIEPIDVRCLSRLEAYAEKFRAALSRREPAIRDFYDLDHAVRHFRLETQDKELITLVQRKMQVPANGAVDITDERLAALRQQVAPQLKPVLRSVDFNSFDLDRAFRLVREMAAKLHEDHQPEDR